MDRNFHAHSFLQAIVERLRAGKGGCYSCLPGRFLNIGWLAAVVLKSKVSRLSTALPLAGAGYRVRGGIKWLTSRRWHRIIMFVRIQLHDLEPYDLKLIEDDLPAHREALQRNCFDNCRSGLSVRGTGRYPTPGFRRRFQFLSYF